MQTIHFFKTKKEAKEITHSLSITSKMPCDSYGLPISACKTGEKLKHIKDSVCSFCYAASGSYVWNNTINAQEARLKALNDPLWTQAMIKQLQGKKLFRWHDSGDIQGIDHFKNICLIAEALPECKFWLPTREYSIIKEYAAKNTIPKNLIIRLSAYYIDQPVKIPKSLQGIENIVIANVHFKNEPIGKECLAYKNNNECGSCRDCWNTDIKAISYKKH